MFAKKFLSDAYFPRYLKVKIATNRKTRSYRQLSSTEGRRGEGRDKFHEREGPRNATKKFYNFEHLPLLKQTDIKKLNIILVNV